MDLQYAYSPCYLRKSYTFHNQKGSRKMFLQLQRAGFIWSLNLILDYYSNYTGIGTNGISPFIHRSILWGFCLFLWLLAGTINRGSPEES